ncbi:hypothetical protein [Glutamicibacter arilaitensis]|uniref:Uncharacterized protein n=1 Tax=Glutamicibacter arilaitensis TaxID=256701 RepID=A0A2N7RY17_9MICC|nr:hypothetical protein [Glutamicibacter arilaitensis]PMQ18761.1 hypothetical protein CIK84_18465 [Glutamicibacter arilaitensis]
MRVRGQVQLAPGQWNGGGNELHGGVELFVGEAGAQDRDAFKQAGAGLAQRGHVHRRGEAVGGLHGVRPAPPGRRARWKSRPFCSGASGSTSMISGSAGSVFWGSAFLRLGG